MDFRLDRRAGAAAAQRARVRRDRDPAARARVGRGAAFPDRARAEARRARAAWASSFPSSTAAPACRPSTTASASRSWRASIPGVALSVAAHNGLCSAHIFMFGTEAQKQRYLVPLARGEKIGAWGLTESTSGSDAAGMRTTADARRRRLGAERLEDVHHPRPRRRRDGRHGGHRPRRRQPRASPPSSSSTARRA